MGFEIPARDGVIEFRDVPGWNGAEVRARLRVSTEEAIRFLQVMRTDPDEDATDQAAERMRYFAEHFLISWNLEERDADGVLRPIPCDADQFMAQPLVLTGRVMQAFTDAIVGVTGVPANLPPPSSNGHGPAATSEMTAPPSRASRRSSKKS